MEGYTTVIEQQQKKMKIHYLLLKLPDQFVFDGLFFLWRLDQSEQSFSLSFGFFGLKFSLH